MTPSKVSPVVTKRQSAIISLRAKATIIVLRVEGNCVGKGDMRAQMEQTFKNLDQCLKAAGASWADVVKTNTFVTDFDEFQKCGDVRMRYLGVATPTSTTVGVTRLAGPDFMIEIEAVAVVNS